MALVEAPSAQVSDAALEVVDQRELAESPIVAESDPNSSETFAIPRAPAAARARAASILGLDPPIYASAFGGTLHPEGTEEVQLAVARALLGMRQAKAAELVIDNWAMYTPPVRDIVLAELLGSPIAWSCCWTLLWPEKSNLLR